jgi:diphthamide synthase (EF-2-diphthine--ammonia ligase)
VREGIEGIAFGDLFLEEIRDYRVAKLAGTGLEPLFPCWMLPTSQLARDMIAAGFRAHLTCIDPRHLDKSFAGREFDAALLADLPMSVDPCGERGEFHTFVSAGPIFSGSIEISRGQVVERDGFVYADLLLDLPIEEVQQATSA